MKDHSWPKLMNQPLKLAKTQKTLPHLSLHWKYCNTNLAQQLAFDTMKIIQKWKNSSLNYSQRSKWRTILTTGKRMRNHENSSIRIRVHSSAHKQFMNKSKLSKLFWIKFLQHTNFRLKNLKTDRKRAQKFQKNGN